MFNRLNREWKFVEECEGVANTAISGKQRFVELSKLVPYLPKPKNVLDVGGSIGSAKWLEKKFSGAKVTILNSSKLEILSFSRRIITDAQSFQVKKKYDMIFCGETIEHVYNTDGLLLSCYRALKPGGVFIITTPNLACLFNRIFLMLGWSPGNYCPSFRFFTGNPLLNQKTRHFGVIGDHKSVFTFRGLKELLKIHGFEVVFFRGFTYAQTQALRVLKNQYCTPPGGRIRLLTSSLLPYTLREGMLFVCKKTKADPRTKNCILPESIWKME